MRFEGCESTPSVAGRYCASLTGTIIAIWRFAYEIPEVSTGVPNPLRALMAPFEVALPEFIRATAIARGGEMTSAKFGKHELPPLL
jgi:hypothetical protein